MHVAYTTHVATLHTHTHNKSDTRVNLRNLFSGKNIDRFAIEFRDGSNLFSFVRVQEDDDGNSNNNKKASSTTIKPSDALVNASHFIVIYSICKMPAALASTWLLLFDKLYCARQLATTSSITISMNHDNRRCYYVASIFGTKILHKPWVLLIIIEPVKLYRRRRRRCCKVRGILVKIKTKMEWKRCVACFASCNAQFFLYHIFEFQPTHHNLFTFCSISFCHEFRRLYCFAGEWDGIVMSL